MDDIKANTGFELVIPEHDLSAKEPTDEEIRLIRTEIDPLGVRRLDYARGDAYNRIQAEIMQASAALTRT